MINWDDLRFVVAVARHATMQAAAEALGSNTATVSRRIQRIEGALGQRLFRRTPRGWSPTELGRQLLELGASVQERLDSLDARARREARLVRGRVRIAGVTFLNTMVLMPRLRALLDRHPGLSVDFLRFYEPNSLAFGEADIAIRFDRPTGGRLIARRLGLLPLGLFAPRGVKPGRRWASVMRGFEDTAAVRAIRDWFGSEPAVRAGTIDHLHANIHALGLPAPLVTCLAREDPDLVQIEPETLSAPVELWLTWHEARRDDPRVLAVKEWLSGIFPSPSGCLCGRCVPSPAAAPGRVAAPARS